MTMFHQHWIVPLVMCIIVLGHSSSVEAAAVLNDRPRSGPLSQREQLLGDESAIWLSRCAKDFAQRYIMGAELGSGSYGKVVDVTDRKGRFYALKYQPLTASNRHDIRREIDQGLLVTKQVESMPWLGFIRTRDYFTCGHPKTLSGAKVQNNEIVYQYIIYEKVHGQTMAKFCRDHKAPVTLSLLRNVMRQTLKNLDSVQNSMNFMHNDIHPGNVMLTNDRNIKIIDYGYSTSVEYPERTFYPYYDMRMFMGGLVRHCIRTETIEEWLKNEGLDSVAEFGQVLDFVMDIHRAPNSIQQSYQHTIRTQYAPLLATHPTLAKAAQSDPKVDALIKIVLDGQQKPNPGRRQVRLNQGTYAMKRSYKATAKQVLLLPFFIESDN